MGLQGCCTAHHWGCRGALIIQRSRVGSTPLALFLNRLGRLAPWLWVLAFFMWSLGLLLNPALFCGWMSPQGCLGVVELVCCQLTQRVFTSAVSHALFWRSSVRRCGSGALALMRRRMHRASVRRGYLGLVCLNGLLSTFLVRGRQAVELCGVLLRTRGCHLGIAGRCGRRLSRDSVYADPR